MLRIIKNASWCSGARGVDLGGKGREAEQNVLPLNFLFLMLCNQLQQAFEIASGKVDDGLRPEGDVIGVALEKLAVGHAE